MRPAALLASAGAAAALLLGGCAELGRAPPPEPPGELSGFALASPLPEIARLAARDFDRAGAALAGRPAETALAAARLEWLAGETRPGGRLAALPGANARALDRARDELRGSLAVRPEAPPEEAVAALVAAHRGLRAGGGEGEAGARAALSRASVFRQADPTPLQRLAEPGPQPTAQIATAALREEMARLANEGGVRHRLLFDNPGQGMTTFGFINDSQR